MDKDDLLAREFEKLSLKSQAPMFFGQSEPQAILSVKMQSALHLRLLNKLTKYNFYSLLQKYDYESLKLYLHQSQENCLLFLAVLFRTVRKNPLGVELTAYFLIQILSYPLSKDIIAELISLASQKLCQQLLSPIEEQDQQERIKLLQYKLSLVRMAILLEIHSFFPPNKLLQLLQELIQTKVLDLVADEKFDIILWLILNLLEHSLLSQNIAEIYKFFIDQTQSVKLSERQKILIKLPQEVGGLINKRNKEAKSIVLSLFSMFYEMPRPLIQESFVWVKQDTI